MLADEHLWVVWEKTWPRYSHWRFGDPIWKRVSSHKTKVAADVAVKRGFSRVARRASHGEPR